MHGELNQPRALEEGSIRWDSTSNQSVPISPTETLISPNSLEIYVKDSRDIYKDEQATQDPELTSLKWLRFWRKQPSKAVSCQHDRRRVPDVTVRSLEQFPEGYANLAAFHDSDESYMMYRRYGYIQAYLLLAKQDELRVLETKLDELDEADKKHHPEALMRRLSDKGHSHARRQLLKEIETKFLEYANLLNTAHQLTALNKPGSGEYESVSNYLLNKVPVHPKEQAYIAHKEDLVSLRPGREHAWLDIAIEKTIRAFRCKAIKYLFCDEISRRKSTNPLVVYTSRDRIERCAVGIITIMILALLIIPIWLLYHLVSKSAGNGGMDGRINAICIGVLLVFTLTFSAMMSLMTRAQRHEILGAAAAYCAVLVVFLGNVGNN